MELEGVDRNAVLRECVRDGLILGFVTGAASGTVSAPVLGTIVGAVVGFFLAIPLTLIAAAAIAGSLQPSGTVQGLWRRIDVTFAVLATGTAALAIGWISLEALVGAWPAVTMLVVVVVGLVIVRRRLHRLAPEPPG